MAAVEPVVGPPGRNPSLTLRDAEVGAMATQRVLYTLPRTRDVLGHVFRDAIGHVNPSTQSSQNRYIQLFENVANNSGSLNPNVLTNYQRTMEGFKGFSQIFRNGKQVWVQTRNGIIENAGVNIYPK